MVKKSRLKEQVIAFTLDTSTLALREGEEHKRRHFEFARKNLAREVADVCLECKYRHEESAVRPQRHEQVIIWRCLNKHKFCPDEPPAYSLILDEFPALYDKPSPAPAVTVPVARVAEKINKDRPHSTVEGAW